MLPYVVSISHILANIQNRRYFKSLLPIDHFQANYSTINNINNAWIKYMHPVSVLSNLPPLQIFPGRAGVRLNFP